MPDLSQSELQRNSKKIVLHNQQNEIPKIAMTAQLFNFSFKAMGSLNEIQIYAIDPLIAEKISKVVISEIEHLESKYSRYRFDSIISNINNNAGKEALSVDDETAALIDYAFTTYQQSNGLFDITSGILRRAWDFKSGKLPASESIAKLLPLVGLDKCEWKKPFFKLALPGMEIDFGGIGKEYAVDKASALIMQSGVQSALLNFGGDIRIIGNRPDNGSWKIGVKNPRAPEEILAAIELRNGAVATSGDYERFMIIDGKRYCHILNPKNGWPVRGFRSVTAICDSCLVAGSIATIAMLYEEKLGLEFLNEMDIAYVVVAQDGKIISSKSLNIK